MSTTNEIFSTKYDSSVTIEGFKQQKSGNVFINGSSENFLLESLSGEHTQKLQKIFGKNVVKSRYESAALEALYGKDKGAKQHKIYSTRTDLGDFISGYSIIDKVSLEVIGCLSLDPGSEPGEVVCDLVIKEKHRNKGHGKEALVLTVALGFFLKMQEIPVGRDGNKEPIKKIAVKTLDDDEKRIDWLKKLELDETRTFFNDKSERESVYVMEIGKIREFCDRFMDVNKININYDPTVGSPIQRSQIAIEEG